MSHTDYMFYDKYIHFNSKKVFMLTEPIEMRFIRKMENTIRMDWFKNGLLNEHLKLKNYLVEKIDKP